MRLICFWCFLLAAAATRAQESGYYAPQTFRQNVEPALFQPAARPWDSAQADTRWTKLCICSNVEPFGKDLFSPARSDVAPQGSNQEPWRPKPVHESWGGPAAYTAPAPALMYPRQEWRAPLQLTKEQQASIVHHKQALTPEGSFRFEYSSDNGLSAGEVIEPDGSRVGAYQYKDPSGQLVKLKYRAGKDGFQILEGSHIPKSPEPVPPVNQDSHYVSAYQQQREQYQLQQQYNQQRPQVQQWDNKQVNHIGRLPFPTDSHYVSAYQKQRDHYQLQQQYNQQRPQAQQWDNKQVNHIGRLPFPTDSYYVSAYQQQREQYQLQQQYNQQRPQVQQWDNKQVNHIGRLPFPTDSYYVSAYQQQREQYQLQQQYNQQRPQVQQWDNKQVNHIGRLPFPTDNHYVSAYQQQREQYQLQKWDNNQNQGGERGAGGQYFVQNWRPGQAGQAGQEDDGQYRENDIESKGPHSFGEGYSFAFQG